MNELLLEILPDIDNVVSGITFDQDKRDEIKQELILKIYDNREKIYDIHARGKLKGWMFMVARNIFIDMKRGPKMTELPSNLIDEVEQHYKPSIKTLDDMFSELSEIERLWVQTYVDCGFNYSEMERRTELILNKIKKKGIARRSCKERIESIFDKWKQLDIYLHQ